MKEMNITTSSTKNVHGGLNLTPKETQIKVVQNSHPYKRKS
jgi:hypothetical protein